MANFAGYITNNGQTYGAIISGDGKAGPAGNGIEKIILVETIGNIKKYRITFTNGTYFDYEVKDGEQVDTSIFATIEYVDDAIGDIDGALETLTIGNGV